MTIQAGHRTGFSRSAFATDLSRWFDGLRIILSRLQPGLSRTSPAEAGWDHVGGGLHYHRLKSVAKTGSAEARRLHGWVAQVVSEAMTWGIRS